MPFRDIFLAILVPILWGVGFVLTKPGMELVNRLKIIRIIEIENFDVQADGGTHVNSTKEIGKIEISKIENKGKHNKRIEVKLH